MKSSRGFAIAALLIPLAVAMGAVGLALTFKLANGNSLDTRSRASDAYKVFRTFSFTKDVNDWTGIGTTLSSSGGVLTVKPKEQLTKSAEMGSSGVSINQGSSVFGLQWTKTPFAVVPGRISVRFRMGIKQSLERVVEVQADNGKNTVADGVAVGNRVGSQPMTSNPLTVQELKYSDLSKTTPIKAPVTGVPVQPNKISFPVTVSYKTPNDTEWVRGQSATITSIGMQEYVATLTTDTGVKTISALRLTWPIVSGIGKTMLIDSIQVVGESVIAPPRPCVVRPSCPAGANCEMVVLKAGESYCPVTPMPTSACVIEPVCTGGICPQVELRAGQVFCHPTPAPACRINGSVCEITNCTAGTPGTNRACTVKSGFCRDGKCVEAVTPTPFPTPACRINGSVCEITNCTAGTPGTNRACTVKSGFCRDGKCMEAVTPTPEIVKTRQGCIYKQVECIKAPCPTMLVCPAITR